MVSKIFGMTASHPPGRMVSSNNILKTEMDVFVRNGKRSSNNILFSTLASILNDGEHNYGDFSSILSKSDSSNPSVYHSGEYLSEVGDIHDVSVSSAS